MSKLWIDQDWETDASPLTLIDTMARSTTNAIDGTDLRGGDGTAKAGQYRVTIGERDRTTSGGSNRHAARFYARFKFKRVSGPTGGLATVMNPQTPDGNFSLAIPDGASTLRFTGISDITNGSKSLTAGTAYWIDFEIRDEGNGAWWARVWVDGVLDIEQRKAPSFGSVLGFTSPQAIGGGASGTKTSWEFVWGRMKVWMLHDPKV